MNSGEHAETLTFLFTDIEGSSALWHQQPEAMRQASARHDAILRSAVESHRGDVVKTTGDGLFAAFHDPRDAIAAAVELQRAIGAPGATGDIALRVRCGLHAGAVQPRDGDFFGSAVNRAARVASVAHGGQILVSQATALLARDDLPDGVALRDVGAVRLRGLPNTELMYQVLHADLREEFPALRSLEATPNNLLQQHTHFIGRENDIAECIRLLDQTRLLTLTGIGGVGKTRLALQLAQQCLSKYPDGVWFVDFAPVQDPQRVTSLIASVLGMREGPDMPLVERLIRHLATQRTLLILDNCEHLINAAAELTDALLRGCTRLKVLATSRESLGIAAERSFGVRSLAMPSGTDITALQNSDAVRLFVDRACIANPAFRLNSEDGPVIAEICRRVDGIPLGVELAAARVKMLKMEEIRARLNDRFRLLTGGSRALPRHQTLLATIQWSYDHLTGPEQRLLRRLSVFVGGWPLAAATAVSGDDVDEFAVLETLTRLEDKSLIAVDPEARVDSRYTMLETVRQYAQDRLNESGESDALRERHLAYFLAFAKQAHAYLFTRDAGKWYQRLDRELSNVLAAHAWCDHAREGAELGLELASSVRAYWIDRGLFALGQQVYEEALAREGADRRSIHRARALFAFGQHCNFCGRFADAIAPLEQALAIAREHGDEACAGNCLDKLAFACAFMGDFGRALACVEEELDLRRRIGDSNEISSALVTKAAICRMNGHLDAAAAALEEALSLTMGDDLELLHIIRSDLARVWIARGSLLDAQKSLIEAIRLLSEMGSRFRTFVALDVAALLAAARGDWQRAARLQGAFDATMNQMGGFQNPYDDRVLAKLRQEPRAMLGTEAYAAAYKAGLSVSLEESIGETLAWMGQGLDT